MKFKFTIPLLIIALVVLGACSSEMGETSNDNSNDSNEEQAEKQSLEDLKVGMSFQELDNPLFISMKETLEEDADVLGFELSVSDAQHDISKQIDDINDMIQQDIDILILNPTDTDGVEAVVEQAHEEGIAVIAVDAQAEGPIDSFIGSKNFDAGKIMGEKAVEDLDGDGKVAILDGIAVTPIKERVEGFKEGIKESDIEIVDTQNGKQEKDEALDVTENMLKSNSDLDAIFSVNDTGSLGALKAIEGANSDVYLYSVDGSPDALEEIEKGGNFKGTAAQFLDDQAEIALGLSIAQQLGATKIPDEVPVDVELVTEENMDEFLEENW